jgi:hypothetical protein
MRLLNVSTARQLRHRSALKRNDREPAGQWSGLQADTEPGAVLAPLRSAVATRGLALTRGSKWQANTSWP